MKNNWKRLYVFFIALFLTTCSMNKKLNQQVDQSQKTSLKVSPFSTADAMTAELTIQQKYRPQYLKELKNLIQTNLNDTIILAESYDHICFGCPADDILILKGKKLVSFQRRMGKYEKSVVLISNDFGDPYKYLYGDILELKKEIQRESNWNANPEKYGTDKCFDGGHTFFTVFYPSDKMESMYMRCWIPEQFRKNRLK